jgi:dTDP-4-dehydrorhamnose 3,5-epimerase
VGEMSQREIIVTPLARITATGGDVMHAIKQCEKGYAGFGEAYFSWIESGAVKAWKRHQRMTMNLVVPVGLVRFVFRLGNDNVFRSETIGTGNYMRLTVPPGTWFGFQGLAAPQSLVLNIASIPHDPEEVERRALAEFEYDWS